MHSFQSVYNMVNVKSTHYCSEALLCLTRAGVLKAEPEEDVGNNSHDVSQQEDGEDSEDINDGQGQATLGKTRKSKGKDITVRRVSQVDSLGTVLYISKGLYIHMDRAQTMVCAYNKQTFLPIRSGVMNNPPIGLFARVAP
jgi:hypothetical protein